MSVVIGLVDNGEMIFGGDSACTYNANCDADLCAESKIFENGPMLIGYVGSGRHGQLLEFAFKVPKRKRSQSVYAFMATTFIDAVRQCFKDGGFAGRTGGDQEKHEQEIGAEFMVGYEGQLFQIFEEYDFVNPRLPYAAIGCGAVPALGAMFSLHRESLMLPGEKKVRIALQASERFNAAVRGPFKIKRKPLK